MIIKALRSVNRSVISSRYCVRSLQYTKNLFVPLEYKFTAAYGDSRIIEVWPSIVSDPAVRTVILLEFALPASSLIIKYWPAEKQEAAGKLISNEAVAITHKTQSVTEEVACVTTSVLE